MHVHPNTGNKTEIKCEFWPTAESCVLVLSVLSSAMVAWMILSPGSGPHTALLLLSTNDEASGTIASLGSVFPDSGL